MQIVKVKIENLKPMVGNPRQGDVTAIKKSLKAHSQYKPIVVRKDTNEILAGNHVWKAAKELGWKEIDVVMLENIDDKQAKQILLIDNQASALGKIDLSAVYDILKVTGTENTGYNEADFKTFQGRFDNKPEESYKDTVARLNQQDPKLKNEIKLGQIWILGKHKLAVGSSSDGGLLSSLFLKEKTDLIITDPPYGINYKSGSIENDSNITAATKITSNSLAEALKYSKPSMSLYMFYASIYSEYFYKGVKDLGFKISTILVWDKQIPTFGFSRYKNLYEPVIFATWKNSAKWNGDLKEKTILQLHRANYNPVEIAKLSKDEMEELLNEVYQYSDIFKVQKPKKHIWHPTAKPVEIYEKFMRNSSDLDDIVYDPFVGGDSLYIAAEKSGRRAFGVELDIDYVYNILKRFQLYTGTMPVLESSGEEYNFASDDEVSKE
jgi:DNA modification methylase